MHRGRRSKSPYKMNGNVFRPLRHVELRTTQRDTSPMPTFLTAVGGIIPHRNLIIKNGISQNQSNLVGASIARPYEMGGNGFETGGYGIRPYNVTLNITNKNENFPVYP